MRVLLKDVARMTGVSESTVSRVLNNKEGIGEATRRLVLAAYEQLATERQTVAREQRQKLIGFFTPQAMSYLGTDTNVYQTQVQTIQKTAQEYNAAVVIATYNGRGKGEELVGDSMVRTRAVDAVILARTCENEDFGWLKEAGIPFVVIHNILPGEVHCVGVDNYEVGRKATEYLIERGHRRIALLTGPDYVRTFIERTNGYLDALQEAGTGEVLRFPCDLIKEQVVQAVSEVVELEPRPTAILAPNDRSAIWAMQTLQEKGYVIGEDISVMGVDNSDMASDVHPGLTTVEIPWSKMCWHAVRTALAAMEDHDTESIKITLKTKIVERDSVKDLSGQLVLP